MLEERNKLLEISYCSKKEKKKKVVIIIIVIKGQKWKNRKINRVRISVSDL